jgi:hypothetical protein
MSRFIIILPALTLFSVHANAASDQECQSLWKTVDVDANGSLSRAEDQKGYIASFEKNGGKLLQPDTLSRDEFLSYCKGGFAGVATESPQNSKDFGKGDLTPGKNPLSKEDAISKFAANGFKDVRDVTLDDKGIWHAVAFADGKDKPVAIDQQGDIVAQPGKEPENASKTDTRMSPPSDASPSPSASPAASAPPAPAPAPMASASVEQRSGGGERSGLALWLWIIVANAAGLFFLNGLGGPTSAMGHGGRRIID